MFDLKTIHISLELWGSILCLIAALCTFLNGFGQKRQQKIMTLMQLCAAALLISDTLAWIYRGNGTAVGYYMVRISNAAVFILSFVILGLFTNYVYNCIEKCGRTAKICRYVIYALCSIGIISIVISQFTDFYYYFDEHNFYHRKDPWIIMQLLGIIGMAIDVGIIIYHRKKLSPQMFVSLMSYSVLAYLSLIALIIFYGISFSNIAIAISMIFMFLTMQIEQAKNYKSKEAELYDLRIEVMLSQIGHHFIFNTLSTIKYLCGKDPKAAEQTVVEFADYLRGTLDSLSENRCIPFETELEHVKNYLAIEKKRFGDRVNVEYDIKETDFVIPALSLQPIVENAVKHGICKREDGGTIKISTYSDGDYFKIKVEDDGIGFDPSEEKNDGMNHIGINNVKSRLHTMCEGTLDVTSEKGIGTTAIITIQK